MGFLIWEKFGGVITVLRGFRHFFKGQEAENVNFRGGMKELENLLERNKEAELENEHCGKI